MWLSWVKTTNQAGANYTDLKLKLNKKNSKVLAIEMRNQHWSFSAFGLTDEADLTAAVSQLSFNDTLHQFSFFFLHEARLVNSRSRVCVFVCVCVCSNY